MRKPLRRIRKARRLGHNLREWCVFSQMMGGFMANHTQSGPNDSIRQPIHNGYISDHLYRQRGPSTQVTRLCRKPFVTGSTRCWRKDGNIRRLPRGAKVTPGCCT